MKGRRKKTQLATGKWNVNFAARAFTMVACKLRLSTVGADVSNHGRKWQPGNFRKQEVNESGAIAKPRCQYCVHAGRNWR